MPTLLLTLILTTAAPEVEVRTLDGRTVVGSIAALDDKQVTVETPDGPVELTTDKLLTVSLKEQSESAAEPAPVRVEMVDGTSLAALDYGAAGGQVKMTLPADDESQRPVIETPSRGISSVRLQPELETLAEEWQRILTMKIETDLLVVRKGDAVDYLKGVVGDVTDQIVQFDLDGDVMPVKRSKVYGLVYYHPQRGSLPKAICRINDAGGSRWSVSSLSLSDGVQWTTPGGITITRPVETLTLIDFSQGKVVYLGDLKPASVTWTPYFSTGKDLPVLAEFYAPRSNTNLESGPLQIDGTQYAKGLSLRSKTEIVYRLSERYSRLNAVVGIDDSVRPGGNVRLVIRGDDRVLLETTVAGTDPAQPIDLDLGGVRRVTILADFGEKMDIADHLDLCEARILK